MWEDWGFISEGEIEYCVKLVTKPEYTVQNHQNLRHIAFQPLHFKQFISNLNIIKLIRLTN